MKKIFFTTLAVIAAAFVFVSCSDNDDKPAPALAKAIAGAYPVNIFIGIEDEPDMSSPYTGTVTITATADNTASLALSGFDIGFGEMPISLSGIKTTGNKSDVKVSYSGAIESDALGMLGELSAVLSGNVKNGKLDISLPVTVTAPTGELHVNVILQSQPAVASAIAGAYPVNIYFGLGTDPDMNTPYTGTVNITATADNMASLSLAGFTMPGLGEIPISLSGIKTSGIANNVKVTYSGPVESAALEALGDLSTVLTGSIEDGELDFSLPVTVTMAGGGTMNVNVLLQSRNEQPE